MSSRGTGAHLEECQFFYKVGACRHGDKCVRRHVLPQKSPAIALVSMPLPTGRKDQTELRRLVEDIFVEVSLMRPVSEMFVAENQSQHLKGNVYISFESEEDAAHVLTNINSRWFAGKPVFAHLLPARGLSAAICRDGAQCKRQLDCNYAHPMYFDDQFWARLFAGQQKELSAQRLAQDSKISHPDAGHLIA